ncbi:hypothetical protein Tco_0706826 [Tanacetum coccineum]|uniref:CCHC-type domain-containing protein n=1 Tax=Tanacetum coccineum TaxID=301880 RepID=A0ABQ4Y9C1_9ASTR
MWKQRIEQYFQVEDYALWDVIRNRNSFKPAAQTTINADGSSNTLIPGPITADEKTQKKNDVKARNTMSFDDLYNNFKIVEQEVKGTANSQNLAFMSSVSSTNKVNIAYGVSIANTQVSTASTQVSTANLSDDTVYTFLASQQNGSHLAHDDLEQIHEDELEEMDLKWQLALLSMRTNKFFQKTCRKITINGSETAGYDKSKVECFNCHKLRNFARECRGPRNQDNRSRNQDSSRRTINVEEISSKAMLAIDGVGFDWSFMTDEEVLTDMTLMAFLDSTIVLMLPGAKSQQVLIRSFKTAGVDVVVMIISVDERVGKIVGNYRFDETKETSNETKGLKHKAEIIQKMEDFEDSGRSP